jgi:isoquinoline 1-oxidoreductase subunit beta
MVLKDSAGSQVDPLAFRMKLLQHGQCDLGLTACLYGEITLTEGKVNQENFNNYKMLSMSETPEIEISLTVKRNLVALENLPYQVL